MLGSDVNVADHLKVTCPVTGALIKNGFLVPDADSLITKEQTVAAILLAGMTPFSAVATTEANFESASCPTCPARINPFQMNTFRQLHGLGRNQEGLPHEHFRSTGVRDFSSPDGRRFNETELRCAESSDRWLQRNVNCFADAWDCEESPCASGSLGGLSYERSQTNDALEDKRPRGCGGTASGPEQCDSQLHGSIRLAFQELASPPGPDGSISKDEWRAFWLDGDFPTGFLSRSPRECIDPPGAAPIVHFGCQQCLSNVLEAAAGRNSLIAAEQYCRCILSKQLPLVQLLAIGEFQQKCNASGGLFAPVTALTVMTTGYLSIESAPKVAVSVDVSVWAEVVVATILP